MNERSEPKVLRSVVCQGRCTGPGDVTFGQADSGTEQMGLVFNVQKGEFEGRRLPWYGSVDSEKALALVKETLLTSGWDGESSLTELTGLGSTDVTLAIDVIEVEGRDGKVRPTPKLRFVNRLIQATMKNPIVGDDRKRLVADLDARMRKVATRTPSNARRSDMSPEEAQAYADDLP